MGPIRRLGSLSAAGICLLLLPGLVSLCAAAPLSPRSVKADSALLLDMETGTVLYAKKPEQPHAPASLVKIMTVYLALEKVWTQQIRLSDLVEVSPYAATVDRYRLGLHAGELVALETLLEATGIASANDAAVAVAEAVGGSEDAFVALMNSKARELGLSQTRFSNPHGLPGGEQYTTATDQAQLTSRLLADFPEAGWFLEAPRFLHRGRSFERRSPLFRDPGGIRVLKTGYTREAGYNLTVAARRGGRQLLVVLLGADSRARSFAEAALLLNSGFRGRPVRSRESAAHAVGVLTAPPHPRRAR